MSGRIDADLKPIAYAPHGGGDAHRAQEWIEAIRAKQAVTLPNAFYGGVEGDD